MYQNFLEQSQKHVWNGAYDHFNYMETRLYLRCNKLQLSNPHVGCIIHLLDRTETNIIFIWSGKVILGEAKPSPNITLLDQINMILGEVLSNKCFIIPATVCAPGPSHALLIQTKRPFTRYQCAPVQVCVLRHLFSNVEFYCVRTGYGVMGSSLFCLKPDERV